MLTLQTSGVYRIKQREMLEGTETLMERARSKKKIILYAEFHYLLLFIDFKRSTFTTVAVDIHNKRG